MVNVLATNFKLRVILLMNKRSLGFFTYLFLITACSEQKSVDSIDISNGVAESLVTGLLNETIIHDGVIRDYLIYLPETYDGRTSLPVVMNFHGGSMDARSQMYLSDMRRLADQENFILVYPQGTRLKGGDTHWNTMVTSVGNKSDSDDIGFIDSMLDTIALTYNIDSSRVYATGYSNGAGFTFTLACNLGEKIAAIAPVSGLIATSTLESCVLSSKISLIGFHGTDDFERPYGGIQEYLESVETLMSYWADSYGLETFSETNLITNDNRSITHRFYNSEDEEIEISYFTIAEGQHDWFDIEIDDNNLNQLIWQFMSRFKKTR
tara:strand:+ start:2767 stop:3735 length:969 start_codon:yes stop_codon:yes gene_type:complete